MPISNRELFAKLIACEAGGEGDDGMRAVATTVMNRTNINYGEFAKISRGGNIRNIIFQPNQYTCMKEVVAGAYNPQNIYNIDPQQIHYDIADWAMSGGILKGVDHSLYFFNPYVSTCVRTFPPNGTGTFHNRVNQHCFYVPTPSYRYT